jgi:type IV secretory pathway VirB4 component
MVDRKLLKNPNGLILGTPGAGKSFSAKREITNVFLVTDDDIIICDPEAEYGPLVRRLHGQVINISPISNDHINPMDLNLNYSDDENPLSLKSDFILSLCELIVGGKDGLQPVEKTIIDRCVRMVYRNYLNDPKPENMPVLEDLYNELRKQDEKEAQYIATALEIYVTGSLNVFNHRTNVNVDNRVISYEIKELGKQLKEDRHADRTGPGLEPRDSQPRSTQGNPLLHRRNAPSVEGGADFFLHGRNLEAFQEVGRHPDRHHPKRERPAVFP